MHTIKNIAEKELNYFFLFFHVAYNNVSHYFLLFLLYFLMITVFHLRVASAPIVVKEK